MRNAGAGTARLGAGAFALAASGGELQSELSFRDNRHLESAL
jgi:hypothetical protein